MPVVFLIHQEADLDEMSELLQWHYLLYLSLVPVISSQALKVSGDAPLLEGSLMVKHIYAKLSCDRRAYLLCKVVLDEVLTLVEVDAVVLPILLEDYGEGAMSSLRDIDHPLLQLLQLLVQLYPHDLTGLAPLEQLLILLLHLLLDRLDLQQVIFPHLLQLPLMLLLQEHSEFGLFSLVADMQGLDIPAMLNPQLSNLLPVMLLLKL